MGTWDKEKRTLTDPDELHKDEATEGMFKNTVIAALDLDQDTQAALNNKMGSFDEADLHKSYAREQDKDDETVTIASRSHQIVRKIKARKNTAPPSGFNIAPDE